MKQMKMLRNVRSAAVNLFSHNKADQTKSKFTMLPQRQEAICALLPSVCYPVQPKFVCVLDRLGQAHHQRHLGSARQLRCEQSLPRRPTLTCGILYGELRGEAPHHGLQSLGWIYRHPCGLEKVMGLASVLAMRGHFVRELFPMHRPRCHQDP